MGRLLKQRNAESAQGSALARNAVYRIFMKREWIKTILQNFFFIIIFTLGIVYLDYV